MDITTKTVVELKALAFDELVKLETAQKNLETLNQELVKRANEKVETKKDEVLEVPQA
jgi:hypothetical protein